MNVIIITILKIEKFQKIAEIKIYSTILQSVNHRKSLYGRTVDRPTRDLPLSHRITRKFLFRVFILLLFVQRMCALNFAFNVSSSNDMIISMTHPSKIYFLLYFTIVSYTGVYRGSEISHLLYKVFSPPLSNRGATSNSRTLDFFFFCNLKMCDYCEK